MIISTEAKNQYNDVIKAYVKAYLYSFDDVYIDELQVINYSYNFSREFGTSILNLEVTYDDSITIEQDQIVVLIEGFDTTVANDKLPKFKGRITIIDDTETADNNTLRLQVYDEISLLQRSEFDGRLTGEELSASNITLTPVLINPLGEVVDTVYGSRIRIGYNGSLELNSLVTASSNGNNSIYIEDNHYLSKVIDYPIKVINNEPHIYYSDLVGSFSTNDIIRNESGSFKAIYKSAISFNRGIQHTPVQANVGGNMVITYTKSTVTETLIKLTTTPEGTPIHNETLYKEVAGVIDVNNSFTVKSFYELDAYKFTNDFPIEMDNISIGDKIHNGMVSFFRAPNPNWSSFCAHKLFLRRKGNITDEDFDDAYDVNYEKGIIKLNTPVNITQLDVIATYKYIEKGLKAEDVLRDIIIADDEYREDVITVGGYDFSNYTNISAGKYSIIKGNNVIIQTLDDMSASKYLGISQVVDINDNLNFEYTFSANVGIKGDMNGTLYIKHDSETPTSYSLASTVNPTLTFNKLSSTTIYLYVSGCSNNTKLTISDTKLTKRNSVIFQFSKANLYSTIKKEKKLSTAPNYTLLKNSIVYPTPLYSYLVDDLDITDTTIYLSDATDFETEGYITIGEEVIHYTSKNGNNISGLTRGTNGTVATNHVLGNRGYETLSASRVWSMEYNNIIPKTEDDTASDYDASIGVNVLSASSFTIVGANFKKGYYREGLVITDAVATSVTLTSNTDYLFSQLQSTGIEFPYVVIDGKNYGNRMDAINEIRTAIAPNYVVRGAVRVDGSDYITYIKGSYLNQKDTQDNDTLGVISITNNINNENYNRVKMYGRLDNPVNIMYNDDVKVYTFNNSEEVYVKGVAYAYLRQDGNYYVYETLQSNTIGNKFIYWSNKPLGSIPLRVNRGHNISGPTRYTIKNIDNGKLFIDVWEVRLDRLLTENKYYRITDYNGKGYGLKVTKLDVTGGGWNYWHSFMSGELYNVYDIKHTITSVGEFQIDDILADGATIVNVGHYDDNNTQDSVIYVRHPLGGSSYSTGTLITNGVGASASVTTFKTQYNYNSLTTPGLPEIIEVFPTIDASLSTAVAGSISKAFGKSGDYTLYLDNKLQNSIPTYREEVVELGGEEKADTDEVWDLGGSIWTGLLRRRTFKLYKKRMNIYNAYIAENDSDVFRVNGSSGKIKAGQIAFEKPTNNKIENIFTTFSKKDSNYTNSTSDHWKEYTLKTAFSDGNYVYYEPVNTLGSAIRSATQIRYFSVSGDIRYELNRDKIYINKDDLKKITNDPRGLAVRVDGNFQFGVDETFTNSEVPAIERLRNMGIDQEGKLEQIGFASRGPIEELPLFVVDMAKNTSISYLDIQGGYFYKPDDDLRYKVTFDITIRHCDKDVDYSLLTDSDFEEINDKFVKQSISQGEVKTFSSEDFGDRFTTRYLKIYVGCSEKPTLEIGTEKKPIDYYGAGIAGLAIYSDDVLVSEAGIDAKVINLYKDTKVYEQLNSQSLLDRITQIKLNEFQKNNNNVDVALLYGPQFEVGDTVYVPQRTQNYFVEEVASTNGNTTLKLSYYS